MSCEDLRRNAAGLAALPAEDAERVAAWTHARDCVACAAALAEGERLLRMIDAVPMDPPSADVMRRVSAAVRTAGEPVRSRGRPAWVSLAALAAWAALVVTAGERAHDGYSWLASIGAAVLAAVVASASLGRRAWPAAATAALASLGLVAIAGAGEGLFASIGVKCIALELLAAAAPLGTTACLARRGPGVPQAFVAAATAGALAGHAALHLTCPVRAATPHLLAFHFAGILLAAAVGLLVTRATARPAAA